MSQEQPWTIGRLLDWTRGHFADKGIEQPRLEAELLLAHVLGMARIDLYLHYELEVDEAGRSQFRDLVRRRAEREPTKYLVGACEFMSLAFKVTPDCLIPRPETELLVEEVLGRAGLRGGPKHVEVAEATEGADGAEATPAAPAEVAPPVAAPRDDVSIIDLCTGSGCVAVSMAVHVPGSRVVASDVSAAALGVARTNAEAHGVADRVTFLEGDLFEPLDAADVAPADFLVANPPYVTEGEWGELAPEIREHEPRGALVAGKDGMDVIARLLRGAPAYLKAGGVLLVEIGSTQGRAVAEQAAAVHGLVDVEVRKDYAGLDRMLVARREG